MFNSRAATSAYEGDDKSDKDVRHVRGALLAANHAALLKRLAEIQFLAPRPGDDWKATLLRARELYWQGAFAGNTADHWAIGQWHVLGAVLSLDDDEDTDDLWDATVQITKMQAQSRNLDHRTWALSTMADLVMVAVKRDRKIPGDIRLSMELLEDVLRRMLSAGVQSVWSTFRQFWRYRYMWTDARWHAEAVAGYDLLTKALEQNQIDWAYKSRPTARRERR